MNTGSEEFDNLLLLALLAAASLAAPILLVLTVPMAVIVIGPAAYNAVMSCAGTRRKPHRVAHLRGFGFRLLGATLPMLAFFGVVVLLHASGML